MYNPFSLENKVILVLGASSGIGRATAIECSRQGAKVILTARNEELLKETCSLLEGEGHEYIIADLLLDDDIDNLVNSVKCLDGLVCNAGTSKLAPIQFIKENDIERILRVNTVSPVLLLKKLLKRKKLNSPSSVVFTSSISGNFTVALAHSLYSLSKGAISSFMKNAALELAIKKIRCNSVNPGMTDTGMIYGAEFSRSDLEADLKNYPLGRYGNPRDIALGIIYLLSDASSWVTGQQLVIDGGFTLR